MEEIELIYHCYKKAFLVSTDSRNIKKDCVFVALKGEHFDGNDFALKVAEEGIASCVIADRKDLPHHERLFIVENSSATLQQLAEYHRNKMNIPVIGITGTNGKTTTKELVAAVLSRKFDIINTQGNFNNHLGVPLTLLQILPSTQIAVVEMGANHPFEIAQLCDIAHPTMGVITNIGKAHLEGFGSFEGVINTKKALYDYLRVNKGTLFVNMDNELLISLSNDCQRITYSCNHNSDIKAKMLSANPFLTIEWDNQIINTQLVGDYNFENVMAAVSIGLYFNVPANDIVNAIESYQPTNNRSQVIHSQSNRIIMDAYNANPVSMYHAIRNFKNICREDTLLILGDMRELGQESEKEHNSIVQLLKNLNFNNVCLVGSNFSKAAVDSEYNTFNDVESLSEYIDNHPVKNLDILIKGSHSIHLEKILVKL